MNGLVTETGCGDLLMDGGGCVVAGAEAQTVEHVMVANRGEWREWPLLGGEIRKMQHGIGSQIWCARARRMCREAGVAVSRVAIGDNGKITVE